MDTNKIPFSISLVFLIVITSQIMNLKVFICVWPDQKKENSLNFEKDLEHVMDTPFCWHSEVQTIPRFALQECFQFMINIIR